MDIQFAMDSYTRLEHILDIQNISKKITKLDLKLNKLDNMSRKEIKVKMSIAKRDKEIKKFTNQRSDLYQKIDRKRANYLKELEISQNKD